MAKSTARLRSEIQTKLLEGLKIEEVIPLFIDLLQARKAETEEKLKELLDSLSRVREGLADAEANLNGSIESLKKALIKIEGLPNRKTIEGHIKSGRLDQAISVLRLPRTFDPRKARKLRQEIGEYESAKEEARKAAIAVSVQAGIINDLIVIEAGLRGFRAPKI